MKLPAYFGLLAAVSVLAGLGITGARAGEEFRIENKIFVGNEKEPRIKSTTILHDGVVYDYLESPPEVTVFDKARSRFLLLDSDRRIKAELTTDYVDHFTERLKEWAQNQTDPFLRFLADPQFEEQVEGSSELSFASEWITYRVIPMDTEDEVISRRYREFSDWHCQLNTLLSPGARPPFARMIVNAALDQRQQMPREVHLTIRPKEGFLSRRITLRSEHLLVHQLVESDRKRVAQTDQFMAMYTKVDFDEYQQKVTD